LTKISESSPTKRSALEDDVWKAARFYGRLPFTSRRIVTCLHGICGARLDSASLTILAGIFVHYQYSVWTDNRHRAQVKADVELADDLLAMAQRLDERGPAHISNEQHAHVVGLLRDSAAAARPIQREIDKSSRRGQPVDEELDALILDLAIWWRMVGLRITVNPTAV
jgi:hypothetical protein